MALSNGQGTDAPRRLAVVVNPTSGGGRGARLLVDVLGRLGAAGTSVDVVRGRDAAEASALLAAAVDAIAGPPDGVVAVGGDGLVNLAVQAVAGTGVPLGIVPAGTGNDVARALGIDHRRPLAALDAVLTGHTRAVDLGRTGGRWFAGVLGSGFDSMVNERANRMSWPRGRRRYDLAILAELRTFRPLPFVLTLDGEEWHTDAMLVAVGNGSSYGGGMRVCPGATMDDGLLDVTVVGPLSTPEFLRVFPRVFRGSHVEHRAVTVRRARTVALSSPGVTAYADGERVGELPVACEAVPAALRTFAVGPAT